jgi:hypothetical protein
MIHACLDPVIEPSLVSGVRRMVGAAVAIAGLAPVSEASAAGLFDLSSVADESNLNRLHVVFPVEVGAWRDRQSGRVTPASWSHVRASARRDEGDWSSQENSSTSVVE